MWINVKSKLPEEKSRVIIAAGKYGVREAVYHYYDPVCQVANWIIYTALSKSKVIWRDVTHWMPLPAQPTADTMEEANLHPPTAPCGSEEHKKVEHAAQASNSRYESAMAVYVEYCEATAPEFKETFDSWLRDRLHSAKAANVS